MPDQILVEKYRPQSLSDMIGQETELLELQQWARSWKEHRPAYRSAYLYGPPGAGKTTALHALAKDFDWDITEVNASDVRTAKGLEEELGNIVRGMSLGREQTLIIIEECDSMHERKRQAVTAYNKIAEFIDRCRNPVALTCNDEYAVKSVTPYFRENSLMLRFSLLKDVRIRMYVEEILHKEGIVQPNIAKLIHYSHGDLRYVLNNLDVIEPIARNKEDTIFEVVHDIFRGEWNGNAQGLEPDEIWYWVKHNIPNFYDTIYGMSVSEYCAKMDMMFAHFYTLRRHDPKLAFRMWKHINTALKLLPMHQKTARIVSPKGDNAKPPIDKNLVELARHCHMSYKKASSILDVTPKLLPIWERGVASIKTTEDTGQPNPPPKKAEQTKATKPVRSLFSFEERHSGSTQTTN
jgi:replication factor C large subunit